MNLSSKVGIRGWPCSTCSSCKDTGMCLTAVRGFISIIFSVVCQSVDTVVGSDKQDKAYKMSRPLPLLPSSLLSNSSLSVAVCLYVRCRTCSAKVS